jgi:hypothetical protein
MLVSSPFNNGSLATDAIALPARAAGFYANAVCSLTTRPPCGPQFSQHKPRTRKNLLFTVVFAQFGSEQSTQAC